MNAQDRGAEPAYPVPVAGGHTAFVDLEDAELVLQHRWCMANKGSKGRPRARVNGRKVYLYRFVMLAPEGIQVDHINGNPMDCRKQNLRYCSALDNAKNRRPNSGTSSKYKGVRWHRASGKWSAAIRSDRKQHWLGVFDTEEQAAIAYDQAAIRLHGQFAKTNAEIFK